MNVSSIFLKVYEDYQNILSQKQNVWKHNFRNSLRFDYWERSFHAKNVEQVWNRLVDLDKMLFDISEKPASKSNLEKAIQIQSQILTLQKYVEQYSGLQKNITPRQIVAVAVTSEMYWEKIIQNN